MLASAEAPRDLSSKLETAGDTQLARVVAMVDALPRRGVADALIAPLRPRLAQLRPQRPLRLSRLLFVPLDAVIVPPPRWRPDTPTIPRSVLAVTADAVFARLGPLAAEVAAGLAGCRSGNPAEIMSRGATLWPAASAALHHMPVPQGWADQSGLALEHWPPLRDGMAGVLALALPIEAALREPEAAKPLIELLSAASVQAPESLRLAMTIVLARHARPDLLLAAIAAMRRPVLAAAMDQVLTAALDEVGRTLDRVGTIDLESATNQAAQLAGLLDAADSPARRTRIRELRSEAQSACAARLDRSLQDGVLTPLQVLTPDDDAGMMAAEAAARDARRFEAAARRLGANPGLDRAIRRAAANLGGPGVGPVDRIRLTEILLGSEEATRLQ